MADGGLFGGSGGQAGCVAYVNALMFFDEGGGIGRCSVFRSSTRPAVVGGLLCLILTSPVAFAVSFLSCHCSPLHTLSPFFFMHKLNDPLSLPYFSYPDASIHSSIVFLFQCSTNQTVHFHGRRRSAVTFAVHSLPSGTLPWLPFADSLDPRAKEVPAAEPLKSSPPKTSSSALRWAGFQTLATPQGTHHDFHPPPRLKPSSFISLFL